MLVVWLLILTVMLFPGISCAISVDIWETGMTINEVVSTAKEHDIPIARGGLITMSKGFDPKLINGDFYKDPSAEYRTTIGERQAIVCLRFTDESKLVYEIETKIFVQKEMEAYTRELMRIMREKYGASRERRDTVFKVFEWVPDKESRISMRPHGGMITITYTDVRIVQPTIHELKERVKLGDTSG